LLPTNKTTLDGKLKKNTDYIYQKLGLDVTFDIIIREFKIGNRKVAFAFIDGLTDADQMLWIMKNVMSAEQEEKTPITAEKIRLYMLPYGDIEKIHTLEDAVHEILTGKTVFLIDGEKEAIVLDIRKYPAREPAEPEIEKITRGSQDGFVETLLFNVGLIRRRVRDPGLRTEVMQVGNRSRTDLSIVYIEDAVNPELLDEVKKRLNNIDVDGIPMAERSLEEFITESNWHPFPEVRYTERADVAAVHLFEGHICIVVDTSPSVMILPVTLFHHMQHAEEFRHTPLVGIFMRLVRMLGILISVFLIPIWLLLAMNPDVLPEALEFIGPEEEYTIPLFIQFILANIGLEMLRMASIHVPSPFSTALGLVGALLIGEIAVEVGIFVPEVLLYVGILAIGIFATPSWELGLANRFAHMFILILSGLLGIYGFVGGTLLVLFLLIKLKSFGLPYMWPLIPFNAKALFGMLLRKPVTAKGKRQSFLDWAPFRK